MRRDAILILLCLTLPSNGFGQELETTVRVAAISFEPVKLDLAGNAKKLDSWFRKAAAGGAKIAVAPEGSLDGYIVNEIIGQEIGADRMRDVAVRIDSPTIQRFQVLSRELDICLVFGFAERIEGDVFNSAVFIENGGRICGKYHKLQFHEGYDDSWWFNRLGKQSRAFETPYGRCGVMICNDRWNPMLAKVAALDGAQFLVIPAFGSTSKNQDEAVLARGVETGLPVIEANVGVSLIVSENKIAAVDRKRAGITFAQMKIPRKKRIDKIARDQTESEFMAWRKKEMPIRLARRLAEIDPRGPARDKDVAILSTSQLEVTIGNNRSYQVDDVKHHAGYNGIFAIRSQQRPESPFVPAYAGWNLEHYFDASPRKEGPIFFEPRHARMKLHRIDLRTVELYQPATPVFKVESWTRFEANEPNYIDFSFQCIPHREDYSGSFLGIFWASYINGPLDKSMYFLDAESNLEKPLWRQLCTQQHNRDSTVRNAHDPTKLTFEESGTLFANESPLRYSTPFFYGRFRDMVLIYVFQSTSNLRFTHSPSGGGVTSKGDDTNPAWDFQLIVPKPTAGQKYTLRGRMIYKKWEGRSNVLAEVSKYLAPRD